MPFPCSLILEDEHGVSYAHKRFFSIDEIQAEIESYKDALDNATMRQCSIQAIIAQLEELKEEAQWEEGGEE